MLVSFATALSLVSGLVLLSVGRAELLPNDFRNSLYPLPGYEGSRVLEFDTDTTPTVKVNWTLTGAVDTDGVKWVADKASHVIMKVYLDALGAPIGEVAAGRKGRAGHFDGANSVALFNEPSAVAVYEESATQKYLYVADSGNHCIRRIDLKLGRTTTIAGSPIRQGLLDGDGVKAKLNGPASIGVDHAGRVFVLDNVDRVRVLEVKTEGVRTFTHVQTLVRGACRAMHAFWIGNLVMREVWCHDDWLANTDRYTWPEFCSGHVLTCPANSSLFST